MKIFRLGRKKYGKDLSGEGARRAGGRWNSKGTAMVYSSENSSLAWHEMLFQEVLVREIEPLFHLLVIDVPDSVKFSAVENLPIDWANDPHPSSTQYIGDQWVKEGKTLLLKVPSCLVHREFNFLINPQHSDFNLLKVEIEPFPINVERYGRHFR